MSNETVKADFNACDALLCEGKSRADFIAENIDRIEIWKKAAESGDAAGQLLYGLCFFYGHGEQENEETAIQWFLKSAEQENAQAQCLLGFCYSEGWGVDDDFDVAKDWMVKAALQGHKLACEEVNETDLVIEAIQPKSKMTGDNYRLLSQYLKECNDGEDAYCELTTKAISDEAAERLSQWRPDCNLAQLNLTVESLSDKAAEALSLWRGVSRDAYGPSGELCLTELNDISTGGANFLLKNPVDLRININNFPENIRAIFKQRRVQEDFGDGVVILDPIEK